MQVGLRQTARQEYAPRHRHMVQALPACDNRWMVKLALQGLDRNGAIMHSTCICCTNSTLPLPPMKDLTGPSPATCPMGESGVVGLGQ
ncbi:hypothetical protein HaLaN_00958, partial [Haematococcus lacustris]